MKESRLPTLQEIEALTAYLPILYVDGFSSVIRWEGGLGNDGLYRLPYPIYNQVVEEFIHILRNECWLDFGYNPEQAYQMLKDEILVKSASLGQVKTMLTFCLRGERFSDGHWAQMIEEGHIRRLLERLVDIKAELFNSGQM